MWGLTRGNLGGFRRALGSALVAGLATALCLSVFGGFVGPLPIGETAVVAIVLAAIVLGAALLAGRWGFVGVWIVSLGIWLVAVGTQGTESLHERFTVWSAITFPLLFSTEFFLRTANNQQRTAQGFAFIGIVWLLLVIGSSYLARYAPDVGMTPRQNRITALLAPLLLLPAPLILSWWSIRRIRHSIRMNPD